MKRLYLAAALLLPATAAAQQPQPSPIQQFNADWQAVGSLMGHVLVDVAAIGKDLADAKEALDKATDKIKILTEENERLKKAQPSPQPPTMFVAPE